jgi:hypothetical protein
LSSAFQEIDAEAGLADAPIATRPAGEADSLEEDIKALERELGV